MAPPVTPGYAGFARIFWMFVGPMLLAMIAFSIAGDGRRIVLDITYFFVLAVTILGRWAEFRGGSPQTADGEPATPAHLRRYIMVMLPLGIVLWVAARVLSQFV